MFADAAAARQALKVAVAKAGELEARTDAIGHLDAAGLRGLLDDASSLAELREVLSDEWGYAPLRLLADASDSEARDLVTESEAPLATVRDALRSVELAVGSTPPVETDAPELSTYRHWIEHQVARAARRLDPAAESSFAARTPTAATAWGRLSQERLTAASVPFDAGEGERPHGVVELRLLRRHADRDVRRRAAEALLAVYEENLTVCAACLDAVIADRLTDDRLRGRDDPMEATLVVDEVDRTTVESLLVATSSRTDILERWYERKREALGLEQIEPHDAMAPVGTPPAIAWRDAVTCSLHVFDELSPSLGSIARTVLDESCVDAERRPGKDGSVFCAPFPPGYGTYVFLNYQETAWGSGALAHELGHATHFETAGRVQPWLVAVEPASAAFFEVPSTFAELAAAEHLAAAVGGDDGKALLRMSLEGVFTLVFSTVAATRFEQDACEKRRSGQTVTGERIDELWLARDREVHGSMAERLAILHWPHPFITRFYAYQYGYATLVALRLSALRRDDPERFARDYVTMLEATGTGTPAQLLALCGLNVDDPDVWQRGLAELDRLCELAW